MKNAPLDDTRLTAAWRVCSLLLGYPDAQLIGRVPLLRRVVAALPVVAEAPLSGFLDYLEKTPLPVLEADYVATFDHTKRRCLYLTYYTYGDTRKRGMALLRFKHAYAAAGLVLDEGELPDHLAVVLEFAATGNHRQGLRLLAEHRAGLELLRAALNEKGSPWAAVVTTVTATLPKPTDRDQQAIARLITEGPPEEHVGLAPYGTDPAATNAVPIQMRRGSS